MNDGRQWKPHNRSNDFVPATRLSQKGFSQHRSKSSIGGMNDLEGSGEHTSPPFLQDPTNRERREGIDKNDARVSAEDSDVVEQSSRKSSLDEKRPALKPDHSGFGLGRRSKSSSDMDGKKKKKKSPLLFKRTEEKSLWEISKEEMIEIVRKGEWRRACVKDVKKWETLAADKGIEEVARMIRPIAFYMYRDRVILVFRSDKGLLWKIGPTKKNWGYESPLRSVILQEVTGSMPVYSDNAEEVFTSAIMYDYLLENSRRIFVYSFQSIMSTFDNQVKGLCTKFCGVSFFMNLSSNDVEFGDKFIHQHDILILIVPLDGRILFSDEQGRYGKIFKKLNAAKQRLQQFPKCVLVLRNDPRASDIGSTELMSRYCEKLLEDQHDVNHFFSIRISIDDTIPAGSAREQALVEAIKTCWKKRDKFPDTCLDWSSEWRIPEGVELKCAAYAYKKDSDKEVTREDHIGVSGTEKSITESSALHAEETPSPETLDGKKFLMEIDDTSNQYEGKPADQKTRSMTKVWLQVVGSLEHLPGAEEKLKRSESLRIVQQATEDDEDDEDGKTPRRALSLRARTKTEKDLHAYLSRSTGKPLKLPQTQDTKKKVASTSTSPCHTPREPESRSESQFPLE